MQRKIYEINIRQALSETLDGETIVINLETGSYYSMNETGTEIWNGLATGKSADEIFSSLFTHYETTEVNLESTISEFIKLLLAENLILEKENREETEPLQTTNSEEQKKIFIVPKLEKYEDMQEMLLADPIHDVDAIGWPKLKETA